MPINDPYAELDGLHAEQTTYPEATREDWPMVTRRRAGLLDVTVSLMFALNRRYHPRERRLLTHVGQCAVRPERLVPRLRALCLANTDDDTVAARYTALITEIVALYA